MSITPTTLAHPDLTGTARAAPGVGRLVFDGTGIDELQQRLRVSPTDLMQLSAGRGSAHGLALCDGPRQVSWWSLGMAVLARGQIPAGQVSFVVPLRAPVPAFYDRVAARHGSVVAFGPEAEYEGCSPAGFEWASIHVPWAEMESLAQRVVGTPIGLDAGGRRTWHIPPTLVDRFVALRDLATSDPHGIGMGAGIPAHVHEWLRLLCHAIAEHPDRATPRPSAEAAHRIFLRADEYLRAHLAEAVYVEDVCAAAQTNERTLQSVFRRRLGLTPFEYLRTLRLHHARRDLLAHRGEPHVTVRAVGRRWGLVHPGRFSIAYREQFGESPSETIAREPLGARPS